MQNCHLPLFLIVLSALTVPSLVCADTLPQGSSGEVNEWLDNEYRKNLERHRDNPDMLVGRGLLADSRHRYVDLLASATGVGPGMMIDTFIAPDGSDPQRTIAVTPVRPADVQHALEFIGMTPGHPIDMTRTYLWPKGERVTVTFYWNDAEGPQSNQSVRAEKLLKDLNWNQHLPELGLRFVGPGNDAASVSSDGLIATAFNSQNTILEVPYVVDKSTRLVQLVANEQYRLAPGQKLRIRIRPEFTGDRKRVHEYLAEIVPGGDAPATGQPQSPGVILKSTAGDEVMAGNFENVFRFLDGLIKDGKEPFLQLHFSDNLSAQSVRDVATFVRSFLIEQDVRIEPSDAHLFYGAFLPRDAWRDPNRRGRSSQPLEIHWGSQSSAAGFNGEITQHSQSFGATAKHLVFSGAGDFEEAIQRGQPWRTDTVFLLVNPRLPYGEIRKVYEMIRTEFPIVYVFM